VKAVLHPQADAEFLLAQQRYTDANPPLGRRFYDEITSVFRRIIEHPLRYKQFDFTGTPPIRERISLRRDIHRKARRHMDHRRHARHARSGLPEGTNR